MPIGGLARSQKRPSEDRVQADAQAAWDAGKTVFVPTIPIKRAGIRSARGNEQAADDVEAIIRMGWRLDTWAVVENPNGGFAQAVPLFVRPGAVHPVR